MKKVLLIICVVVAYTLQAQVDTLRGRVPYFHYNYYDSNWCKSQLFQGTYCCIVPFSSCISRVGIANSLIGPGSHAGGGYYACSYMADVSEIAIRMDMDSAINISGIAFGYNTIAGRGAFKGKRMYGYSMIDTPQYNTEDYIFNIYDQAMGLLFSDTIPTDSFRIDCYIEAGFKSGYDANMPAWELFYTTGQVGYETPAYIGMCKVYFDTIIHVPDTFYIGITSSTPIHSDADTMLVVTAFYDSYGDRPPATTCMPYESRRYRIAPGKGDSIQYWADEECHYGVQTCLYPILALPCGEVTNLRCHTIGSAGIVAYVEWDAGVNDSAYEVSYGPEGTPAGEGTVFETTIPQFVHALDRNTHYDFYVRARCDLDTTVWTAWSEPLHVHLASMTINDAKEPFEWSLTPNPAHWSATVQCETGMTSVELLTVKGERIMLRDMAGRQTCTLDLSGLARGIYIVQVTTPKGTAARKLAVE